MKSQSVQILLPYLFVLKGDKMLAVPTFVGSTLIACFLLTFAPALAPLWSSFATTNWNVKK